MLDRRKAQHENISQPAANGASEWMGYLLAALVTAVALEARLAVQPWLPVGVPFVTFYAASALAAWFGGRGPGMVAIGLGYMAGEYFLTSPFNTLKLVGLSPSEVVEAILYL